MRHILKVIGAVALALVLTVAIGACGGHHRTTSTPVKPVATQPCPPNRSQLGCASRAQKQQQKITRGVATPAGALIPDVSVWQGIVSWPSVAAWQRSHGWHLAGIFKMGEYTLDSRAIRNASETLRLGFWRAGYWFVRATGVSHEAALIVWAARLLKLKVIVLDIEVPEARGYARQLAGPLRAAGLIVVEYTAPGVNPDGSSNPGLDLWLAAFGLAHVPCLFTCHVGPTSSQTILAWQFTDGKYGPVQDVPGIGRDDVSVDYGLERLGAPARTICFGKAAQRSAACSRIRAEVAGWQRGAAASGRAYKARKCDVLAQRDQWFAHAIATDHSARGRQRLAFRRAALAATRRAERTRRCGVFIGREQGLLRLANQTVRRYS